MIAIKLGGSHLYRRGKGVDKIMGKGHKITTPKKGEGPKITGCIFQKNYLKLWYCSQKSILALIWSSFSARFTRYNLKYQCFCVFFSLRPVIATKSCCRKHSACTWYGERVTKMYFAERVDWYVYEGSNHIMLLIYDDCNHITPLIYDYFIFLNLSMSNPPVKTCWFCLEASAILCTCTWHRIFRITLWWSPKLVL